MYQTLTVFTRVCCCLILSFLALVVLAAAVTVAGMLAGLAGVIFSALLPLLLLGLLFWLFQYLLYESRPVTRPLFRNVANGTVRGGRAVAAGCYRSAGWLLERSGTLIRQLHAQSSRALEKVQTLGWRVGGIALETVCGGVLLGSLAGLTKGNFPGRLQEEYVVCAILVGVVVGFGVGVANYWPARSSQRCPVA